MSVLDKLKQEAKDLGLKTEVSSYSFRNDSLVVIQEPGYQLTWLYPGSPFINLEHHHFHLFYPQRRYQFSQFNQKSTRLSGVYLGKRVPFMNGACTSLKGGYTYYPKQSLATIITEIWEQSWNLHGWTGAWVDWLLTKVKPQESPSARLVEAFEYWEQMSPDDILFYFKL